MGYSKYPNQLDDSSTLPPAVDLVTEVKAEAVNRLRDAILAIEAELGIQPSGAYGAVKARLDAMQAQTTTIGQDLDALELEIGPNPSGTFDTASERFTDFDAQFADLQSQIDAINIILATSRQIVSPIISGSQDTNSSTFVAKGAIVINPTSLGAGNTFTVEVILQTTNATYAASFELFNVTEGSVVSHPAITTTATNATLITVTLTVGGVDLPLGQNNVLEGRINLASGAGASDRAVCKYAAIRTTPV